MFKNTPQINHNILLQKKIKLISYDYIDMMFNILNL